MSWQSSQLFPQNQNEWVNTQRILVFAIYLLFHIWKMETVVTLLGSCFVFLCRKNLNINFEKIKLETLVSKFEYCEKIWTPWKSRSHTYTKFSYNQYFSPRLKLKYLYVRSYLIFFRTNLVVDHFNNIDSMWMDVSLSVHCRIFLRTERRTESITIQRFFPFNSSLHRLHYCYFIDV